MYDELNVPYQTGYDDGFAECRKEALLTIVMASLFSGLSGFLGGMAFVDFVF